MSNIFYTEVDRNLQLELNARGRSGFYDRSEKALNFMLGKIAAVECTAYSGNNATEADSKVVGILGGAQQRTGRYLASGPDGFLTSPIVTQETVNFYTERDDNGKDKIAGNAYVRSHRFTDSSGRTGPYLQTVDIQIGDHSMGLMNSATLRVVIPNPQRDLDEMEQVWFRPGRYVKIQIEHPKSALVASNFHGGYLQPRDETFWDKMRYLYPVLHLRKSKDKNSLFKMNEFSFEGLITDFDFSYTQDGTVEATLSLRGTSNVYTDVSMYLKTNTKPQNPTPSVTVNDIKTNAKPEFYDALYSRIVKLGKQFEKDNNLNAASTYMMPFTTSDGKTQKTTDHYVLVGEPYQPSSQMVTKNTVTAQTNFTRYITLGALIQFVNDHVLSKMTGNVENPMIVCSDTLTFSNYYDNIISCDPENVLLLPQNISQNTFLQQITPDCNTYGELVYYPSVFTAEEWKGVYEKAGKAGKIFPSRIFLNIETIQTMVTNMSVTKDGSTKDFTVAAFIAGITNMIKKATASAIQLGLVTNPTDSKMLMLADTKFVKDESAHSTAAIVPYSIPMFSNHPNGTVVKSFNLSAKMPDNLKALSYVLNQGDELTESQIAPHMNFMFNAQDKDQINELTKKFKASHNTALKALQDAREVYGRSPGVEEHRQRLYKALAEYIKYPVEDWRSAQQMTAPLYPFEASVTLDGIQGFRYGDVVQFDALPLRYRTNTVFSIMSITHTVTSAGEWTTELKCSMRSSID